MFFDEFTDCAAASITIAPFASRDKYSAPTYGTAVSYPARVIYKRTLIRRSDGSEKLAKGMIWCGAADVQEVDQITLPDGTTPPILSADEFHDETGFSHTKIMFG